MDDHPTNQTTTIAERSAIHGGGHGEISIGTAILDLRVEIDRFGGRTSIVATSRPDTPFTAQGCRYDVSVDLDAKAFLAGRVETHGELRAVARPGHVDLIRSFPVEAPYDAESRGRSRLAKALSAVAATETRIPPSTRSRVERILQDLTVGFVAEILDHLADTSLSDRFSRRVLDDVAYDRVHSVERVVDFSRDVAPWSPRGLAFACVRPDGRPIKLSVDARGAEPLGPGAGILFPTIVGIVEAARRTSMNPTGVPGDGRGAPLEAAIRLVVVDGREMRLVERIGDETRSTPFDTSRPVLAGTLEVD